MINLPDFDVELMSCWNEALYRSYLCSIVATHPSMMLGIRISSDVTDRSRHNARKSYIKVLARNVYDRSRSPEVFSGKGVLKICSKFTGEHPYQSVISIKLLCNFIEIALWHGCSPVNLLHIFRTTFYKNTFIRNCVYRQ